MVVLEVTIELSQIIKMLPPWPADEWPEIVPEVTMQ